MRKKTKIAIGVFLGFIVLIMVWMWVYIQDMGSPQDMAPSSIMAPPPEVATPPKEDPLQAIDRVLERMELGNIAFNAPKTMNLHDSAFIHLVLCLSLVRVLLPYSQT
ncbi:MAG: hypothetical protein L3J94_12100 [Gammaproteobacteria bacterium]|nr:hypothetical protein [Gammaproteobacteria bacterium]